MQYDKAPVYEAIYGMSPYPAGEERAELNKLFQKFFDEVRVIEEGGVSFMRKASDDVSVSMVPVLSAEDKETIAKVTDHFGTTKNWKEVGYITPEGSPLDFSGKNDGGEPGVRSIDHRDVNFIELASGEELSIGMPEFMRMGNIRISPESGGFEITQEPTQKQIVSLKAYIQAVRNGLVKGYNGVLVEFNDPETAEVIHTVEYGSGVLPDRIINDIINYYRNGIKPVDIMRRVVSTIGYYSTVEDALDKITQGKGTPEQFKAMLLKNGAKQAEMDWMDFDGSFADKKSVTKADIQEWIDQNKIEVQEVVKGDSERSERLLEDQRKVNEAIERRNKVMEELGTEQSFFVTGPELTWHYKPQNAEVGEYKEVPEKYYDEVEEIETIIADFDDKWNGMDEEMDYEDSGGVKYKQYSIPGGENYKELLLTIPQKPIKMPYEQWLKERFYGDDRPEARRVYSEQIEDNTPNFRSSHWDERNILAHIRFDERVTPDGEKVLFIQEIQSDWAQQGKKVGYKDNAKNKRSFKRKRKD